MAKFVWPTVVFAFSGLTFVYFVKEAPEQITTSIIPILVYFTVLFINKKIAPKRQSYFPKNIPEYLLIVNSFLVAYILFILFVIEDYLYIQIGLLIVVTLACLFTTIGFIPRYIKQKKEES